MLVFFIKHLCICRSAQYRSNFEKLQDTLKAQDFFKTYKQNYKTKF